MKNKRKLNFIPLWKITLPALIVFLVACVSPGQLRDVENQLQTAEEEVNRLYEELEETKSRLARYEGMEAELERLRQRASELEGETEQLEEIADDAARREQREERRQQTASELQRVFEKELAEASIELREVRNEIRMIINESVLFRSGRAEIRREGEDFLRKLAAVIKNQTGSQIQIDGHTDDRGIGPRLQAIFPTNWELGAIRAVKVVRFLAEKEGIEAARLQAASSSQYRPIADNTEAEGRAQNRRIEVNIILED